MCEKSHARTAHDQATIMAHQRHDMVFGDDRAYQANTEIVEDNQTGGWEVETADVPKEIAQRCKGIIFQSTLT